MLSIIITHHKTPELLKLCLKNIKKHCTISNYEIIIADSESSSRTKLLIKDISPLLKFIAFKENVGYAKLVNAGLREAKNDFILILNADILVLENSIEKLIYFMKTHPEVGLLGPQLLAFDGIPQHSCFRFYTPLIILYRRTILGKLPWTKKTINEFLMKEELANLNQISNNQQFLEADWLMGSAIITTKEAVARVGLMDERFFMYFEDVDWAKRFWQAGYKVVYLPKSKMLHYHQKISKKSGGLYDILINKYTRIHLLSALKYFWKHGI